MSPRLKGDLGVVRHLGWQHLQRYIVAESPIRGAIYSPFRPRRAEIDFISPES